MSRTVLSILTHHLTLRRAANIAAGLSAYLLSNVVRRPLSFGRPFMLMVEPSNLCNLNCPLCPTGAGTLKRPKGNMSLDLFRRIIDELGDDLLFLSLWNVGEPFMNPDFLDMIRLAKEKKIYAITSTNGHFFGDRELVRELIRSGLDELIISIDGASPETYRRYRQSGDIDRVMAGIRLVTEEKKALGRRRPLLDLQFIVMRHNEHELETIQALARSLGVDRLTFKTVQVTTEEEAAQFLPARPELRRYSLHNGHLRLKGRLKNTCRWLWFCPVINWDGQVVPCCFDKDNDLVLGSIGEGTPFRQVWRSQPYARLRRNILTARRRIDLCCNCSEGAEHLYLKRISLS